MERYLLRRSVTYPARGERLGLGWVRNLLVRRSPMGRSIALTSSSSWYSWGVRLLVVHHGMLLLRPLHYCNQRLDLLHQGSKKVLLGHRWWEWRSERLHRWTMPFITSQGMAGMAGMAGGGFLRSSCHYTFRFRDLLLDALCSLLGMPIYYR